MKHKKPEDVKRLLGYSFRTYPPRPIKANIYPRYYNCAAIFQLGVDYEGVILEIRDPCLAIKLGRWLIKWARWRKETLK